MTKQIPGHLRSSNVWLRWLFLVGLAYFISESLTVSFGILLLLIGNFFDDQGTHLSQANHESDDLTPIEILMQRHRLYFTILGWALAIIGLLLILL